MKLDIQKKKIDHNFKIGAKYLIIICGLLYLTTPLLAQKKYSLKGSIKGFEDGTKITLLDEINDSVIGSAILKNNTFHLKGNLKRSPMRTALIIGRFKGYRSLWLEEKITLTYDPKNGKFYTAQVVGSETEKIEQAVDKAIKMAETDDEKKNIETQTIIKYNDNIYSAFLLSVRQAQWDEEAVKKLYNQLSEKNKKSIYGTQVLEYLKLRKPANVGNAYLDFLMPDTNGIEQQLSTIRKEKVILIEFWASWCHPCRKENPNLKTLHKEYQDRGFEIVAVSIDIHKEQWKQAIIEDEIQDWMHVSDLKGNQNIAYLTYGVYYTPYNILIDAQGTIIARNIHGEALDEKLNTLLKSK